MTRIQQQIHAHGAAANPLQEWLLAIGPAAILAPDDLEAMYEQAASCEHAMSSDAGVQALIELAQQVRSPQSIDLIRHMRNRVGASEITLTGDEIRLLLKLAVHVSRRKRKLRAFRLTAADAANAQNATLVSVPATRKTPQ